MKRTYDVERYTPPKGNPMTQPHLLDTYTLGVDISHHQGNWDPSKAHAAGARFAFIRASAADVQTGACYVDRRFQHNAPAALQADLLLSFYHFMNPAYEPAPQAQFFHDVTQDHERHFPLILDIERDGGLGKAALADCIHAFLIELENLSGQKPILYTSASFWNYYVGDPPWAMDHRLWIARYSTRIKAPWSAADSKYKPLSWDTWTWWQQSADGNGRGSEFGAASADICIDWFNGTHEQLKLLSSQLMGLPEPEVPEDALERLWRYAIHQGWDL
jgi:lysozyme